MSGPYSHGHSAALPPQPMLAASVSLGPAPLHGGDRLTKHGLQVVLTRLHPEPCRAMPGLKSVGPRLLWGHSRAPRETSAQGSMAAGCGARAPLTTDLGRQGWCPGVVGVGSVGALGNCQKPRSFRTLTSSTVAQSAQESPAREAGLLMTVIEGVVGVPGSAGEPSRLHLSQEA